MNNPAQALEARLIADWIWGRAQDMERGSPENVYLAVIAGAFKDLAQDIRRGKHRGDPTKHKKRPSARNIGSRS